jgi:LDH2 family malate/lactate/ureidoglycolate dehydrogenase
VRIVHETPLSAQMDGGNHVGYLAVWEASQVTIAKARTSGIAVVGMNNSWFSGRNAWYVESIVQAGYVALHTATGPPHVLPPGAARPALGTNPLCFGFPSETGPVIIDLGTASVMWGDVLLHAQLGQPLPEGIGFDAGGRPSRDGNAVAAGGIAPFGGPGGIYKGYGIALAVQALGLLGGGALTHGNTQDFGFLFIAVDPKLLLPGGEFSTHMAQLVDNIKATPRQPGVDEIRIPSERAFREREVRRREGIVFDRAVVDALNAL